MIANSGIRRAQAALSALFALAMAPAAIAQDERNNDRQQPLGPSEEVLEDGQIVTHLVPGQRQQSPGEIGQPQGKQPQGEERWAPASASRAPSVLAIVAHPDDELILAPILARIAREKGEVTLVFATSGDAGPGISGLPKGDDLAELRTNEARCAAFALGLEEPIFWGFGDGTLADGSRNTQTTMRDMGERIAGLIAVHKPEVVMTWGPDGGYGHADHRITSNAITQVVQAMGPERPDLLYAAFPAQGEGEEGPAQIPGFEGWARTHPSLITDRIAYENPDLSAAIAAVDCYESQFDAAVRRVLAGTLHAQVWRGKVSFRLAFAGPS